MEKHYRKAFYFGFLQFVYMCYYWGGLIYFPYFFKQSGVSDARIGLLISLISLTILALVVPIGIMLDRISPKYFFLIGALVGAAFPLLFLFKNIPKFFELYILIFGVAVALLQIAISALFLKEMGEDSRGGQSAIFSIGDIMGAGIGSELGGLCLKHFGLDGLFWMMLGFAGLLLMVGLALPKVRGIAFHISEYKEDLKHPLSWILIFIVLMVASHAGFEYAGYTLLQTEVIGLNTAQVGRLFLYISISMSIVTYLVGELNDRIKKQVLLCGIALVISGIFQAASGYAHGFNDFLILRILHTTGDSTFFLLIYVMASLAFTRKRAGGSWALIAMVRNAGIFLFANLGGIINQNYGFPQGFLVSGIILVLAGAFVLVWLRPKFQHQSDVGS